VKDLRAMIDRYGAAEVEVELRRYKAERRRSKYETPRALSVLARAADLRLEGKPLQTALKEVFDTSAIDRMQSEGAALQGLRRAFLRRKNELMEEARGRRTCKSAQIPRQWDDTINQAAIAISRLRTHWLDIQRRLDLLGCAFARISSMLDKPRSDLSTDIANR
jgi:hypothetical protein